MKTFGPNSCTHLVGKAAIPASSCVCLPNLLMMQREIGGESRAPPRVPAAEPRETLRCCWKHFAGGSWQEGRRAFTRCHSDTEQSKQACRWVSGGEFCCRGRGGCQAARTNETSSHHSATGQSSSILAGLLSVWVMLTEMREYPPPHKNT